MSQFKNLVFEGGGVKGIAYAGAIKVLEERGLIADVGRIGGTSAGAITAALLACGAGSDDVREIVGGTNFRRFMDDSWGIVRDSRRLIKDFGWYQGAEFGKWMKKQIYSLCGKEDLTFAGLEKLKGKGSDRFRSLYVIGTNLSLQMPKVFSAEDTPDMPIWFAVRISMSIPLFFEAVKMDGDVYVDGGVTWNYPIDLFDDIRYISDQGNTGLYSPLSYPTIYSTSHIYNKETLGFRVDTKDEIAAEKDGWRLPPVKIREFTDYAKALLGFMNEMANKAHLHKNDWDRTVFIDAKGVRTTDFDLSDKKVELLVDSGIAGSNAYFGWFEKEESGAMNRV